MKTKVDINNKSWSQSHTPSLKAKSMFYYLQSGGHFYCNSGYITDRNNYNTMLLVYTIKGEGFLKYRDKSYDLTENKGFFINCMEPQIYGTKQDFWEMLWIHFNGSESNSYLKSFIDNNNQSPVFNLSNDSIIPKKIKQIHQLLKKRNPQIDIKGSCLIVEILTNLLLQSQQHPGEYNTPSPVKKTLNEIENNYYKSLKLDDLAQKTGVSKYHLSRLFKKHTGYSPYEYLINYRLSQAKDLLKTTDQPIYKIADKVGFNNSSHFVKLFRKKTDTTPLKFRNYWR